MVLLTRPNSCKISILRKHDHKNSYTQTASLISTIITVKIGIDIITIIYLNFKDILLHSTAFQFKSINTN